MPGEAEVSSALFRLVIEESLNILGQPAKTALVEVLKRRGIDLDAKDKRYSLHLVKRVLEESLDTETADLILVRINQVLKKYGANSLSRQTLSHDIAKEVHESLENSKRRTDNSGNNYKKKDPADEQVLLTIINDSNGKSQRQKKNAIEQITTAVAAWHSPEHDASDDVAFETRIVKPENDNDDSSDDDDDATVISLTLTPDQLNYLYSAVSNMIADTENLDDARTKFGGRGEYYIHELQQNLPTLQAMLLLRSFPKETEENLGN